MIRRLWLVLCLSSVAAWIFSALGRRGVDDQALAAGSPGLAPRLIVGAFLIASLALLGQWLSGLYRDRLGGGRLLLLLLLAAAFVRLIGIDHEIEERYYLDEGTYYRHASDINDGEILQVRFAYPHLTYYLYAFTLFVGRLFPSIRDLVAGGLFGVVDAMAVEWLWMRLVVAALATAATVPVFRLAGAVARDLEGLESTATLAAGISAIALLASTLFNEISHLMISDGPSAVFATFCAFYSYRAWQDEALRDYLLAGVTAALAAASKYPAGLVAIAVCCAWLLDRIRKRDWTWSLVVAGLASISTFVLVMPSLLVYPRIAFTGGQGIFFGVRQYGGGGWIGVMPSSNWLFYGQLLVRDLGLPLVLSAFAGGVVLFVQSNKKVRLLPVLLQVACFPVAYVALVASMNMVVRRNLLPVTPTLCVLCGVLATVLLTRLPGRAELIRVGAAAVLLALPSYRLALQTISLARPGTRVLARDWIEHNLPHGTYLVKESYTPDFEPGHYAVQQTRFAPRPGLAALQADWVDYVLLSSQAYGRFLDPDAATRPHHDQYREIYRTLFDRHERVKVWEPSAIRDGPRLELYRGGPLEPRYGTRADFLATDLFTPDGSMRERKNVISYTRPGQWLSSKAFLARGQYEVQIDGRGLFDPDQPRSTLELVGVEPREDDSAGGELSGVDDYEPNRIPISEDGAAAFEIGRDRKLLIRLWLPRGARVRGLSIEARPSPQTDGVPRGSVAFRSARASAPCLGAAFSECRETRPPVALPGDEFRCPVIDPQTRGFHREAAKPHRNANARSAP